MKNTKIKTIHPKGTLHTLSEFRREAGIPLVIAKKMVMWGEVKVVKTDGRSDPDHGRRSSEDQRNISQTPARKSQILFARAWSGSHHRRVG